MCAFDEDARLRSGPPLTAAQWQTFLALLLLELKGSSPRAGNRTDGACDSNRPARTGHSSSARRIPDMFQDVVGQNLSALVGGKGASIRSSNDSGSACNEF